MEVIGFTLTVTHEAFTIAGFILDIISTCKSQSEDFASLEIRFEQQQLYLKSFAEWFVTESNTSGAALLYNQDERWRGNVIKMFLELRRLVSDYARLAMKHDKRYQEALEFIEDGKWIEVQVPEKEGSQKTAGAKIIRLLAESGEEVSLTEIFSARFGVENVQKNDETPGIRARWAKKLRIFEWGLFDFKRLSELVQKQEDWTNRLIKVMQFALMPTISQNVPELQRLTTGDKEKLGFSVLAKTRLAILDQLGEFHQEIDPTLLESVGDLSPRTSTKRRRLVPRKMNGSIVLIEYKTYHLPPGDTSGPNLEIARQRIQCISRMLSVGYGDQAVSADHMAHLQCLGYFHERRKQLFGLVYAVPRGSDPVSISLHQVISSKEFRGVSRPTLDERVKMAQNIGKALLEWFLVDWVHKSISSMDIAFFRKSTGVSRHAKYDFFNPYLCGFEYARQSQGVSNDIYGSVDVEFEQVVYRHPARQGVPTETFRKIHDVYAFGVLLLEIGLWQVARDMFPTQTGALQPGQIKKELVRNAQERLGHYMGSRYRDVVVACLEGNLGFEPEEDNLKGTRLMEAFKEIVLDALDGVAGLAS